MARLAGIPACGHSRLWAFPLSAGMYEIGSGEVPAKLQNGRSNRAASFSERVLAQRCVGLAGHPLADARGSVGVNGILQVPQVSETCFGGDPRLLDGRVQRWLPPADGCRE